VAIYNFNLLVGYLPTGVDYAQGYRAKLLRELKQVSYFIFTEIPEWSLIKFYLDQVGLQEEEMLSVHFSYLEDASLIPQLSFDEIKPGYPDIVNMEETSFYGGVKTF